MGDMEQTDWQRRMISPEKALAKVAPGMRIFLGTGVAEPRTLVKHLVGADLTNLVDLELIQLAGFGQAVSAAPANDPKYRFKTFVSGWIAGGAVAAGRADLIPCRFSRIPRWIQSGRIPLDAAFIQISPPDAHGWCSLGMAVDAAKQALAKARLKVGEVNPKMPRTSGDTHVRISEFDWLVASAEDPHYFGRWTFDGVTDRMAAHAAAAIADGSCLAFSFGPLFEALAVHLSGRRDLGIHTPFFTDALMDLVNSGAVTNRFKKSYAGKSVTSYAVGTPALAAWLDGNPMVEFYGIDKVFDPLEIGANPGVVSVLAADRIDLSGRVGLPSAGRRVAAGPEEAVDFINGAELSPGGLTIVAVRSRDAGGRSNIKSALAHAPDLMPFREAVDMVVTEYGLAGLAGKTLRERAQALIDIAHPEDRGRLVEQAKSAHILYPDQQYVAECAGADLPEITASRTFKNGTAVRFRAIRPADEEQMRRLFYRFSDEAVYYRYFSPVQSMPHEKMQQYVNVDCRTVVSVVGGHRTGRAGTDHCRSPIRQRRPCAHCGRGFRGGRRLSADGHRHISSPYARGPCQAAGHRDIDRRCAGNQPGHDDGFRTQRPAHDRPVHGRGLCADPFPGWRPVIIIGQPLRRLWRTRMQPDGSRIPISAGNDDY